MEQTAPPREINEKALLVLVIAYQVVCISCLVGLAYLIFNAPSDYQFFYVPGTAYAWALAGAVAGASYRLAKYHSLSPEDKRDILAWIVVKPFLGVCFGAMVYLVVVSGNLILNESKDPKNRELLFALVFVAGFSDAFADMVIKRLTNIGAKQS